MISPIGELIVRSQEKARKRPHTETAECGCQVTATPIGTASASLLVERCYRHPKEEKVTGEWG